MLYGISQTAFFCAEKAECAVSEESGNKDTWLQFVTIFFG
jgi:hypothetical protein